MEAEEYTSLLYLVKRLERAIRKRLDAVLADYGLTTTQYTALTTLARHDDLTSAALARHSFVTAQTMAQLLASLEERGLIERHPHEHSQRKYLLALSPAGQSLLRRIRTPVMEVERQMVGDLSVAKLVQVRSSLRSFLDGLEHDVD